MSDDKNALYPKALGDRVLVRQDAPKTQVGLIHLPQGSEQYPNYGTIVHVGARVLEPLIVAGARVLFQRRPNSALAPDLREGDPEGWAGLIMLREEDVLAVVDAGSDEDGAS